MDQAIAERVIVDSVPERAAELREIWAKYDLQFAVVSDSLKIGFRSRGKVIEFDNKTMRILWVLAHSAWRMFVCYSPHVLLALATGCSIDLEMMQRDQGLEKARASFEGLLYVVRNAVAAQSADDVAWPLDLPDPMADRSSLSAEQKAVFDLAIMATAYGFLHEVQHVMFAKDKNAPPRRPDEEIACDVFARDFLLAKIDSYAKTTSWSADLILMKRAMAIALGAFFV